MHARESVAVAIIAVYIPLLLGAIFATFKQGFTWFYTIMFALIKIAGASVEIAATNNPGNQTLQEWAAILYTVGFGLLLLAVMGLLHRVANTAQTRAPLHPILIVLHLTSLLALALGILGGTRLFSKDEDKRKHAPTILKASSVIFLLTFLTLVPIALFLLKYLRSPRHGNNRHPPLPTSDRLILFTVWASFPFIFVRVLYSLLATFKRNKDFNIINGDVWVQFGMAIVMEMVVEGMFVGVGAVVEKVKVVKAGEGREMVGEGVGDQYPMNKGGYAQGA